jgi:hypothetical protein
VTRVSESRWAAEFDRLFDKAGVEAGLRALIVWLTRHPDHRAHHAATLFVLKTAYEAWSIRNGFGARYRAAMKRLNKALEATNDSRS